MNKKIIIIFFLFTALMYSLSLQAQDIQFSQFYAIPMYQNPAFAGSAHTTRAILHQRLQWPRLDGRYITSLLSVDHYFSKYNSGFGIMFFNDMQGASTIGSLDISFHYAYEIHLSSNLTLRTGLSASYVNRSLDYARLRFPSQFNDSVGFLAGVPSPFGIGSNKVYPDVGSGGILYTDKVWLGFSAHHMNVPNQSFIGSVSRLPVKFAFTGGYKIKIEEKRSSAYMDDGREVSITPTFHYKFQGKSDQLDLGVYGLYDMIMLGMWYRGLPIVKQYDKGIQNNESLIFLVGWKVKSLSISYSYDWTISKLHGAGTGGSHELNLTYLHHKVYKKKKPMKRLPCPQFYKH